MRVAGEGVKAKGEGRESRAPRLYPFALSRRPEGGWTLIELIITLTVMAILTMAVIPIARTSIRRQREQQLRAALREMRAAIDEFKRDTIGMQCGPGGLGGGPPVPVPGPNPGPNPNPAVPLDPRSRVVMADCTIFGVENPERYPPTLDILVEGVDVLPRQAAAAQQFGSVDTSRGGATANTAPTPKKKIYLREIPVDPMTGRPEWCLLSNYDPPDSGCASNPNNVFDVRSKSDATALNGNEKYSEW